MKFHEVSEVWPDKFEPGPDHGGDHSELYQGKIYNLENTGIENTCSRIDPPEHIAGAKEKGNHDQERTIFFQRFHFNKAEAYGNKVINSGHQEIQEILNCVNLV
ncbi:hypothetical protein ACTJKN_05160 [Pedobacter sp. 22163]|uniref:hypothetical protein n=1 Tax=Pedobacter sp. 22163 TaxID=3453883 RepID=UPI003F82DC44